MKDVFPSHKSSMKAPVPVKYRSPHGDTWSGRGQKHGQDMRYASAEIKGSCFELKICLGDVVQSSKVAKLNSRKV